MRARLCRKIVAVFTASGLLGLLFLPAEHVHTGNVEDGHHAEIIHRHADPHRSRGHGVAFEDRDDTDGVQWLSVSFVKPQRIPDLSRTAQLVENRRSACRPPLAFHGAIDDVSASAHDPPWRTHDSLRGPPSFSL